MPSLRSYWNIRKSIGDDIVSLGNLCIGCAVEYISIYVDLTLSYRESPGEKNEKASPKCLALIIKQKNNDKKQQTQEHQKTCRCIFAWLLNVTMCDKRSTSKRTQTELQGMLGPPNLIFHFPTFTISLWKKYLPVDSVRAFAPFLRPVQQFYSVMNALTRRGRGLLVAFEGCDRSGKSTQCQMLVDYLKSTGRDVAHFCFPGELM